MGDVVAVVALMNIPAAIMLWKQPEITGRELQAIAAGETAGMDAEPLLPEIR
jgi:hypothetical protein